MIHTHDRSFWFGASDTDMIVGNWSTQTFKKWWLQKLGLSVSSYQNKYTRAGTFYEGAILRSLGFDVIQDYQVKIPELSLRVNYDGVIGKDIYEVKTYKDTKDFKVSKSYWRQAQTEMFALESDSLKIVSYPLCEDNYRNYFIPIDKDKIQLTKVERDDDFIYNLLIPNLKVLHEYLKEGKMPERS